MDLIGLLLDTAKGKIRERKWEEVNKALRGLSLEEAVLHEKAPEWVWLYAHDVLEKPWPEGERVILRSSEWSYRYSAFVLREPWPEGEEVILKSSEWSCYYARNVLRKPWPEGEKIILKSPEWASWYTQEVLKKPWLEGEKEMENSTLKPDEPHPSAMSAKEYLASLKAQKLDVYLNAFSSCAIENNRPAAICAETLRRLMHGEPVSDRYLLGLAWTIRDMERDME